ncbi:alpha-amylase family glycosyl hydrolase [Halobacillus litoralis]|uniref:alpha-amylase family glycosyl hydrolase n=1 Tax=Halobacillus litoralis TaxID=45668 RepID=UPI001CFC994C|nr:alpha-amylase family glycosyl hydrolase [Halobacillus litoralis]WLR49235.1 alpha-amylase family glycosyl hydrolase [Halobacillus litoralis]
MIQKRWIWLIGIALLFLSFAQPVALTYADAKTYDDVVLRGNAETLDWSSDNNPLTYNAEEGVWLSEPIPLEGGKVTEFKFVYDGNWMPGANLTYTAPQDAEYIFAFHPEDERKVDIRLADTYEASVELELTAPEGTPEWVTPTVASSKNGFHYTAAPMTKTSENTYTTKIVGQSGEEVSYFYSLAGESYKEDLDEPRTVTLSTSGDTKEDTVTQWKKVPVAQSVTHDYNHTPYVPDHRDDVTVKVEVQHFGPIDKGAIYYTMDGTTPDGKRGEAFNGQTVPLQVTDTFENADGLKTSIMEGVIPSQKKETRVKYKLDVWNSNSDGSQFADNNVLSSDEATEFAYYVDTYESPEWAKEAVIYQVFVDRFRDGSTENNTSVNPEQPYDEQLKGWMGGDLQGVLEKMDYIEDLGVNTLWISPIYEGPYSHGYHPTDFMNIDPRFGSNQLMKELVTEAHKRDMKVVYDLVPNHTSDQHDFFQDALEKGPDSPYYDWYTFTNYPNEYETFYGIQELPELNNDNPETRAYMLDEVVPFWMNEIGVDGFRLDYAKGPSQSFWVDFRHKVKSLDEDAFIFGEVWDNLDTISSYKGKLDGAIDFETHSAMTNAFIQNGSVNALASSLEETFGTYGDEFVAATFLDSHDMPRFLFEADGNEDTLKNAAALQFTLPGAPIIYYGDEVGLSQSADHNSVDEWKDRYYREMMIWEEEKQNEDILSHYKTLIDARNDQPALTHGDFNIIYSDDDVLVFERSVPQDKVLVVMNLGEEERKLDIIDLYNQQTPNKVQLTSLLEKEKLKSHKGKLEMTSEAASVAIYDVKGKLRYEAPSEEKKYNKVVLRGSAPFDWSSDDNMLTFDEQDALWKSEPIELTAGETVEYKFVRDGEWLEGDNLRFTPEADGEYIFIFDPQNEYQITVKRMQAMNEAA